MVLYYRPEDQWPEISHTWQPSMNFRLKRDDTSNKSQMSVMNQPFSLGCGGPRRLPRALRLAGGQLGLVTALDRAAQNPSRSRSRSRPTRPSYNSIWVYNNSPNCGSADRELTDDATLGRFPSSADSVKTCSPIQIAKDHPIDDGGPLLGRQYVPTNYDGQ